MEIRFAPWRMAYMSGQASATGCVLCDLAHADPAHDAENLVLYRGQHCFVVMNLYPYNTGHLMVVPNAHTADLVGLDEESASELFALTRRCVALLGEGFKPHGYNLGMNLGKMAGAGIAEHLHMHIVPRWTGDTNFFPIIGGTKLVPQKLEESYALLRPLFETRL